MRFLVVQHNKRTPAGLVGERLLERGHTLDITMPHFGGPLPDGPGDYSGLLVLGGEMSAADDNDFPHYEPLRKLIRSFGNAGRPVMGICLGAQIIARAYGAPVYRHTLFEFGYLDLDLTADGHEDPLLAGFDPLPRQMQFHEDTFDLPDGAVHLIAGSKCVNQGFRIGDRIYAFQFHLETTDDAARAWARYPEAAGAWDEGTVVERMEQELVAYYDHAAAFTMALTDRWLDLARRA